MPCRAPHLRDTLSRPSRLPSPRQYTEEISAAFEEVNITLSPISLLSESQGDLLLNASRAAQPPDFTHTLEQVGGLGAALGLGAAWCRVGGSGCTLWGRRSLCFAAGGDPGRGPGSVLPHGDGEHGGEAPLSAPSRGSVSAFSSWIRL